MTDLEALAARVEGATAADRDLDALIAPLQGLRVVDEGHPLGRCCYDQDRRAVVLRRYTASLDAAMTLVPEGWRWEAGVCDGDGYARTVQVCGKRGPMYAGAATPALALTAAALRARAHLGGTHDR